MRKFCTIRSSVYGVISASTLLTCFQLFAFLTRSYKNPTQLNYFLDVENSSFTKFIVDTSNCQIIDIHAWDQSILPFVTSVPSKPNCWGKYKHWTHSIENDLVINETAIIESGYSRQSVRCCYKTIYRVEQTLENYNMEADNIVRFSDTCVPLTNTVTPIRDEFIRVICTSTSWPALYEIVYRAFHAFTPVHIVSQKNGMWEKELGSTDKVKPPNVILLGVDSMSRQHFHRSMNKTKRVLQNLGAIEMLGYTKIGENTWPNTLGFLSGYNDIQLPKVCYFTSETELNSCPYIWKRFSKANYITATVEDAPGLTGFNYLKTGFVQKPTDFYFRPFMLGVHKLIARSDYYTAECIDSKTAEETMLNYIWNIMKMSVKGAPVFVHTWMTNLAHQYMNSARFADETFEDFLVKTDLNNTVLFFLSDHGYRYGAIRETLPGWYEDKLPTLWIYLPEKLKTKYPSWVNSLKENSKRLTSPFDLYHTMNDILKTFTNVSPFSDGISPEGTTVSRVYGQSLFKPVPEARTCKEAGITINFCACLLPKKLSVDDSMLRAAAETAVSYLNALVPSQCAKMSLASVSAGAVMAGDTLGKKNIVVTFITSPGQFLFEGNVVYDKQNGNYSISTDLLRMNKIQRDTSCVNTSLLERYCYCL